MLTFSGYIPLHDRGLITVSGEDRHKFLQGLITNDMTLLKTQTSLYACLLTHNGRFLHDFILYENHNKVYLDCEGGERALDLLGRLQKYTLRANIDLSIKEDCRIYTTASLSDNKNSMIYKDPRHPNMGWRSLEQPKNLTEQDFTLWDEGRIRLCIPDGSRDILPEKSTMLESNIDQVHGLSWSKGCYIGQELTARTNYRGTLKKQLYSVEFKDMPTPAPLTDLHDKQGRVIGQMRSSCGQIGLALLKKDAAENLNSLSGFIILET